VIENTVLRIIYGHKRGVTRDWRRLHNEELHNLYASSNIIMVIKSSRMRWTRHVAQMGKFRNGYSILVEKPEGKRLLGKPRSRWEDIIMYLRATVWEGVDWIHLVQDRDQWRAFVNTVMNLQVP
jgi:hypothetical protein